MPIKGLTDRTARFPLLGTIRKGEPKTGNAPGKDSEFFRLDSKFLEIEDKWKKAFGEQVRAISCLIPYPTTQQAFPCWMEEYGKTGLKTRCDGEQQVIWAKEDGSLVSTAPKPCKMTCDGKTGCKQIGRLSIMIPSLGEGGYFEVQTHSKWDIIGLSEQLLAIESIAGSLIGVPFLLERTNREISVPMNTGRARVTKSLLSIRIHPKKAEQILNAAEQKAFSQLVGNPLIEEGNSTKSLPQWTPEEWHSDARKWASSQGLSDGVVSDLLEAGMSKSQFFARCQAILKG
jgi:hypothetical protein